MIYHGRTLDAVALWGQYVDFPSQVEPDGFAPLTRCPNPDHHTDKRHFQVNLDRPLVHCFANCGISGTYEKALSMILGCTEREARKKILEHCRVDRGPSSKRKVRGVDGHVRSARTEKKEEVSLEFETYIPQIGTEYLTKRGIVAEGIAEFGLGWDVTDRRIVIPADDERGIRRFLIKRAVRDKDWPKYLYWPEKEACGWGKTDLLFAACHLDLRRVSSDGLVLCEGSLDAVRLHQHGVRNAVAILGTKLSRRQVEIIMNLRPRRIFTMFDKDVAGWHNIQSAEETLTKFPIFVCLYPRDKSDPAEMSRREVERSIEGAIPLTVFKQRLPKRLQQKGRAAYAN